VALTDGAKINRRWENALNDRAEVIRSRARRLAEVLDGETRAFYPRLRAVSLVSRLVPLRVANGLRASILRQAGFHIGEGTLICGTPNFSCGEKEVSTHGRLVANLSIGEGCLIEVGCTFELDARITIGDRVTIGHQVIILTATHELGPRTHRAGPIIRTPVNIESGVWIGARSLILPGITLGEGSVVAPGSVVNKDVAPHARVGGIPAKQLEVLEP
jgi:maltose O-acetyltransferase